MATSSHSMTKGGIADTIKQIRATPGFKVEDTGTSWKVINAETGKTKTVHKGGRDHVVKTVLSQIKNITGWTTELFEAAEEERRAARVARGRPRVEHKVNTFLAELEAPFTEGQQMQLTEDTAPGMAVGAMEDTRPSVHATRGKGIATVVLGLNDVARWEFDDVVFTITLEAITPIQAQAYLDKIGDENSETGHRAQRPASVHHIESVTLKMIEGKFGLSPDMILFNLDDQLINGQHRFRSMVAAWMSGKLKDTDTYLFLVSRLWPRSVFYIVDHNRVRTLSDTLYLQKENNHAQLAKAVRRLYLFDHVEQKEWRHFTLNDEHGVQALEENPFIRDAYHWKKMGGKVKANGIAMWLANYLCRRASDQKYGGEVDLWFDRLCQGYELEPNSPAHKLNRWFMGAENRRTQEKLLRADRTWLHLYEILLQWNNTMANKTLKGDLSPQVPFTIPQPAAYLPPELRPVVREVIAG